MANTEIPQWLAWARELQALSQTGLAFSTNDFDTQRYTRLQAIAAEMAQAGSGLPAGQILESFRAQKGYATPKVDVRAAVVRAGRILLVQERSDERWCLPGGWADVGDTPAAMAVREAWEESGFVVTVRKLIGVFDANRVAGALELYHAYKLVFLCDLAGGEARASNETLAAEFFDFAALPPLSSARTGARHLREVLAHVNDPQRPAAFE